MPTIVVQTRLPLEEYQKLTEQAQALRTSKYQLAQELIIIGLNEKEKTREKKLLQLLSEFFKEDLKHSGT